MRVPSTYAQTHSSTSVLARSPACLWHREMPSRRLQRWFLGSRSSATAPDLVSTKPSELLTRVELQRLFAIACKHMPRYVYRRILDLAGAQLEI